jgi:SAM-dependent methyltransferase
MGAFTDLRKRLPGYRRVRRFVKESYAVIRSKPMDSQIVFTDLYHRRGWGAEESISGTGSAQSQTEFLRHRLPELFQQFGVSAVLDLPCGDFNWMRTVDLRGINYIGGDVVEQLVRLNTQQYACDGRAFRCLDITSDDLPTVDLILCRDCLVHLSFADILLALQNVCRSGSTYLLATTFPLRKRNADIPSGKWRPLNLTAAPFNLPEPVHMLNEHCTEWDGRFADKSLGLWKIEDIERQLFQTSWATRWASLRWPKQRRRTQPTCRDARDRDAPS